MRTRTTTAPDGTRWSVQVRFLPRWRFLSRRTGAWRRRRREGCDGPDLGDAADLVPTGSGGHHSGGGSGGSGGFLDGLDEGIALLVVLIGFVALAALGWFVLIPLLLLVVDVVVVAVLLVAGVLAHAVLRRPWEVVAGRAGAERAVVSTVVGWRAALRHRDVVVGRLAKGAPVEAAAMVRGPRRPARRSS